MTQDLGVRSGALAEQPTGMGSVMGGTTGQAEQREVEAIISEIRKLRDFAAEASERLTGTKIRLLGEMAASEDESGPSEPSTQIEWVQLELSVLRRNLVAIDRQSRELDRL